MRDVACSNCWCFEIAKISIPFETSEKSLETFFKIIAQESKKYLEKSILEKIEIKN